MATLFGGAIGANVARLARLARLARKQKIRKLCHPHCALFAQAKATASFEVFCKEGLALLRRTSPIDF